MWESQVRDLLKTTPRWQCWSTSWRVEQSSTSSGWCSDFFLLDIVKITVLMKLKSINHWMDHIYEVFKSELRRRADSIALCTISSRHASSANNLISHSIWSITAIAHTTQYQSCVNIKKHDRDNATSHLQCRVNVHDIGPRINQQVRSFNTWYNSTVQTKTTKVISRQTSPFNCGTPLFFVYHYYKSFRKRFIQKNQIAVHTKNKKN